MSYKPPRWRMKRILNTVAPLWKTARRCQHYDNDWQMQCERPLGHTGAHGR